MLYTPEMDRRRAPLKFTIVFGTLLSLVVATSVVHYHVAGAHDVEFCAGHLNDDAADVEHRGICVQCPSSQRYELALVCMPQSANFTPEPTLTWQFGDGTQLLCQLLGSSASPRAPPVFSLRA
jgi:hypothetical protein